ncbi:AlpA family phage regulatory protein [Escherichia coli]|uniref:helix-turn-helix transcriptional regulator n=1 Tax=Escherichia coli TaxID=562 RepID=UPI00259C9D4D|nr:AlpA family phage regulatory protein [Escherichia coli]MDM4902906.1 AlpA family phage regulatory protein [Escherichia coli]MDM4951682.1 AlpA family phage regulatory protein [Escherichia coli]
MKKMAIVDKKGLEYIPNIDRMIREKECRELTTLANSTRWKLEKEGKFPKRIKIGSTAVVDWPPESPDNQYHLNK